MKNEAKLWFDMAQEDWENALLLWKNHRYGLTIFSCQQAVEKILKAYIVEYKNKVPSKTHRIENLIEEAGLDLSEIQNPQVIELSKSYIRVRYPDLNQQYFRSKELTEPLFIMSKGVFLWVKNKFKKP